MSPVPHRGLRFGVLLPFACALLGWAASRIGAHPSIRDARQQVVSAMARPTHLPCTGFPTARVGNLGSLTGGVPRDPFDGPSLASLEGESDPWVGFGALRLGAIYRSPGGSFAVIGGRVVRPGDAVCGFLLVHCDADAVWLTGPVGSRRLGFQPRMDPKPGRSRS